MSSRSSTTLLISAAALAVTATQVAGMAGGTGQLNAREIGWEFSTAARQMLGPNATTVAVFHGANRGFGNEYSVSTSAGDFDMKRATLRLAFDPARTRAGLHGGCTYRFSHHGPRTEFSPDPTRYGYSVVYPNITSARHIPTAACPTNQGPTAAWQNAADAQADARFCDMNRLSSDECRAATGRDIFTRF